MYNPSRNPYIANAIPKTRCILSAWRSTLKRSRWAMRTGLSDNTDSCAPISACLFSIASFPQNVQAAAKPSSRLKNWLIQSDKLPCRHTRQNSLGWFSCLALNIAPMTVHGQAVAHFWQPMQVSIVNAYPDPTDFFNKPTNQSEGTEKMAPWPIDKHAHYKKYPNENKTC